MSNRLAIATVTATLQDLLAGAVNAEIPAATVVAGRPDARRQVESNPGVNLFLYEVVNNPFLRNEHQPTRSHDGTLVDLPIAALDLHYLLTFTGRESSSEPQLLLGAAVIELASHPVLTAADITRSVAQRDYLGGSDLADSVDRVVLSPLHLTLEELSRLWSMMVQEPYAISLQYRASAVLLTPGLVARRAKPVEIVDVALQPQTGTTP
jgi:Pvc16 N-terminal domain